MKTAIRYLRFSQIGQSNGSIERQELYTDQWLKNSDVKLIDSFIDRGHSAKTFDRPDFEKLQNFIAKHHKHVNYLVVDQLDRFSRDAGESLSYVKKLQQKFSIQIVSVTEGIVFDYDTPGSFFRAGLQLLLAEEDNINRSIKVRGGMYTAKAKDGRFVQRIAPFGYRKEGDGKARHLVIVEEDAKIIRYIFDAYLKDVPLNIIKLEARKMGHNRGGNMAIERILQNPAYAALNYVKPFKEYPGGLFPANHEPIIDLTSWQMVQYKMKKPQKNRLKIDDSLPLRGVLKCHCGNPVSGAPSRGKSGKYFYYYKCRFSGHNNISATNAHKQLSGAFELMSVPERRLSDIRIGTEKAIEKEFTANKQILQDTKKQLDEEKSNLFELEEKWIKNHISKETYDRWYGLFNEKILDLNAKVQRLSGNTNYASQLMNKHLHLLTDMKYVYETGGTLKKQELVKMVFDSNLYYKNNIYRTPTMIDILSHNHQKMKHLNLLILEKKEGLQNEIPHSGE
ncbi:recombinase family protein [Parapedobacter sp.]